MEETKDNKSDKLEGVEVYTSNPNSPFMQLMAKHGAKVNGDEPPDFPYFDLAEPDGVYDSSAAILNKHKREVKCARIPKTDIPPIVLSAWLGCDTYCSCAFCGHYRVSEAPQVVLRRNQIEFFAVDAERGLVAICLDCAERYAPELYRKWEAEAECAARGKASSDDDIFDF